MRGGRPRVINALGWLLRPQWFVTNIARLPPTGDDPPLPPGARIRLGSPSDASALAPLIDARIPLPRRFARGDIVLLAELDGRLIGCTWLTTCESRPSYFPIKVSPRPGEWYNYGLSVLPQHRGRGLGRALSRAAMAEAARRGGRLVFGHAYRFNRIAAASHVAAGFTTTEELIGLTVLNRFTLILCRRRRGRPA